MVRLILDNSPIFNIFLLLLCEFFPKQLNIQLLLFQIKYFLYKFYKNNHINSFCINN